MKIAVLSGDGIGVEIVEQALRVLRALELPLEMETALVGGAAYARRRGWTIGSRPGTRGVAGEGIEVKASRRLSMATASERGRYFTRFAAVSGSSGNGVNQENSTVGAEALGSP